MKSGPVTVWVIGSRFVHLTVSLVDIVTDSGLKVKFSIFTSTTLASAGIRHSNRGFGKVFRFCTGQVFTGNLVRRIFGFDVSAGPGTSAGSTGVSKVFRMECWNLNRCFNRRNRWLRFYRTVFCTA